MPHLLLLLLVTAVLLSRRAVQKRPRLILERAEEESISFSYQPFCLPVIFFCRDMPEIIFYQKLHRVIIIIWFICYMS